MTRTLQATALIALLSLAVAPRPRAFANEETLNAYAEFRLGDALIVDGQRVKWQPKAKFKGQGNVKTFDQIPLGWETVVKGVRQPDGSILANQIEVKPNGTQAFENDVKNATNEMEQQWVKAGAIIEKDKDGKDVSQGKLFTSGADVDRVRGIVNRLFPPYLKASDFRVYVAENKEWNAFACANGMIVVFDSLLHATNDNEMAIVLGHELTHATHEHSRKEYKSSMTTGILGVFAGAALSKFGGKAGQAAALGSQITFGAMQNGYSRDKEDQADRVGLRYAYEGQFDVLSGPRLWNRFAEKYGSQDAFTNYLFGDHSRAEVRAHYLQQQIALNYSKPR